MSPVTTLVRASASRPRVRLRALALTAAVTAPLVLAGCSSESDTGAEATGSPLVVAEGSPSVVVFWCAADERLNIYGAGTAHRFTTRHRYLPDRIVGCRAFERPVVARSLV